VGVMNDSEVKIKARDEKIKKLSKYIRELEKKIDKQNIDLIQMRSVYQGNVQLQDINIDLEKKIERLQRKIERLKGKNE
jgi:predicted RNase H-like nuclease (RuvC/YqgF family)